MNLTHINSNGKAEMVYVSHKNKTIRTAKARGEVVVSSEVFNAIKDNQLKKGDVLTVAKIAGITGAKKTSELIPLCHNIFISKLDVNLSLGTNNNVIIESYAKTEGETGIEMEALTAVNIAALTVYDMCKAIDKSMKIMNIQLVEKTGGKSGNYSIEAN